VEPVIGIELGTKNTRVAAWIDDKVVVIPNEQGNKATPSHVSFSDGRPEETTVMTLSKMKKIAENYLE